MEKLCQHHINYAKYMHRELESLKLTVIKLTSTIETLTNIVDTNERRLDRLNEKVGLLQKQASSI